MTAQGKKNFTEAGRRRFKGCELLFPGEDGVLQEADAAVPTEYGVVIAYTGEFFRFG